MIKSGINVNNNKLTNLMYTINFKYVYMYKFLFSLIRLFKYNKMLFSNLVSNVVYKTVLTDDVMVYLSGVVRDDRVSGVSSMLKDTTRYHIADILSSMYKIQSYNKQRLITTLSHWSELVVLSSERWVEDLDTVSIPNDLFVNIKKELLTVRDEWNSEEKKKESQRFYTEENNKRKRYRKYEGNMMQKTTKLLVEYYDDTHLAVLSDFYSRLHDTNINLVQYRKTINDLSSRYKFSAGLLFNGVSDLGMLVDYSLLADDFEARVYEWLINNPYNGKFDNVKDIILQELTEYMKLVYTNSKEKVTLTDFINMPYLWAKQGAGLKGTKFYTEDGERVKNSKWSDAAYLDANTLEAMLTEVKPRYDFGVFGKSESKEATRPVVTGPMELHLMMQFISINTENYRAVDPFVLTMYNDEVANKKLLDDLTVSDGCLLSTDANKFDNQVPLWFISGICQGFHDISNNNEVKKVCTNLMATIQKWYVMGKQITYGLPSGLRWTSLIGSLFNCIINRVVARLSNVWPIKSAHQGDDAIQLHGSYVAAQFTLKALLAISYDISVNKSSLGAFGEYLRNLVCNLGFSNCTTEYSVHTTGRLCVNHYVNRAVTAIFWRKPNKGDYGVFEEEEGFEAIVGRWLNLSRRSGVHKIDFMLEELNKVTGYSIENISYVLGSMIGTRAQAVMPTNNLEVSEDKTDDEKLKNHIRYKLIQGSPIMNAVIKVANSIKIDVNKIGQTYYKQVLQVRGSNGVKHVYNKLDFKEYSYEVFDGKRANRHARIQMTGKYDKVVEGLTQSEFIKQKKLNLIVKQTEELSR